MKCIILTGAPCSGKSTIGEKVNEIFKLPYISSGDIARKMAEYDVEVEKSLNEGNMAPEQRMRNEISTLIGDILLGDNNAFIMDGFPRNIDQLEWLKKTFPVLDIVAIHISVTIATASDRNRLRGRSDSKSFDERLHNYIDTTYPMLGKIHNFHTVINDGELSMSVSCTANIIAQEVRELC